MKLKIVFLCSCVFFTQVIHARENPDQQGLTLEQAIIRVLENHPKLKVVDYEAQAMAARLRQALLPPPDRININLEDFAGTGAANHVQSLEATLSLSRTLELGNKAAYRGEVVESRTRLLLTEKDSERLDVLTETTRRFLHVAADQQRLKLAKDAIELLQLTEQAVNKRIDAGKAPITERQRITIDQANYDLELDHRRHEMESSRLSLATLWNRKQPDFEQVKADLFALDTLPAFDEWAGLLERNPDLVRHIKLRDLSRAKIRLAKSKRKPDIDLSAGIRYLGNNDDVAFILSASIPLGTSERAQHNIDEAEALSLVDPLQLEQKELELYTTLFEFYQEMKHAKDAVEALRGKIIPATEKMLAAYKEGYQAGRYSLLELIQVQQLLLNAKSRSLEMAVNYHSYRIEIDRLTGAQLYQR